MKIFKCVIKVYCQNCLLHLRFSTFRQELNPKDLKYFDQGHWSVQWNRFVAHATQSNDKSTPQRAMGASDSPLSKIYQNEWVGAITLTCRAVRVVRGSSCAVKAFWALQTLCHTPRWAITPCRARLGSAAPHDTVMSRWTWSTTDCCLWRRTP